ncbi:plasmid pRiA4b ORF-3 family protein [Mesorhizobium sp. M7A.F.Ca.MR.362.00.0.0]|nr:plasmid pRiA4b ORF-3 family protein [Mesorhizobium sp. M7A.F.Ca.MR.362.00.0.0]
MRYGSWEAGARSPVVTLGNLQLRKGSRFLYEYDLNTPWEHEVRLEERRPVKHGAHYPACTGGESNCPPEDCGGPGAWMWQRDEALGPDLHEDLATALEFITEIGDTRSLAVLDDPDRAGELQELLFRIKGRATLLGQSFEERKVNDRLRQSEHLILMHQQM